MSGVGAMRGCVLGSHTQKIAPRFHYTERLVHRKDRRLIERPSGWAARANEDCSGDRSKSLPMYGNLLLLDEGRKGTETAERVYLDEVKGKDEAWLRDILFDHPEIIPVEEIDSTFAPLVPLCKELGTDAGLIDAAFINARGRLTIIECKLWKNPQARREVVAQGDTLGVFKIVSLPTPVAACSERGVMSTRRMVGSGSAVTLSEVVVKHVVGIDSRLRGRSLERGDVRS